MLAQEPSLYPRIRHSTHSSPHETMAKDEDEAESLGLYSLQGSLYVGGLSYPEISKKLSTELIEKVAKTGETPSNEVCIHKT